MVAEWIVDELKKTKAALEAKMEAQVLARQKQAETEYVVPKEKALDDEKNSLILAAKTEHDETIKAANIAYETRVASLNEEYANTKKVYRDKIYAAVRSEIEKGYLETIAVIDKQINK